MQRLRGIVWLVSRRVKPGRAGGSRVFGQIGLLRNEYMRRLL
ncbi:MAG: hypothetical protein JWR60_1896 [Polaromonas sp.]|nr:hypothetical protein [Polaromonas sp.]